MFDAQQFVQACRAALASDDSLARLTALVADALVARAELAAAAHGDGRMHVTTWCDAADLTAIVIECPVGFAFPPHDHRMASVVGIVAGVEDNIYYARRGRGLVETARRSLRAGELAAHDADVVHAIANGADVPLVALHVYAGDFFRHERSEWLGDPAEERRYDLERLRRLAGHD